MSVRYSEIRDTLKTGDLVSWKAGKVNSLFSAVLKIYQKILKPKSVHVGIVLVIGGRVFVVEARPPQIRIYPLSRMENFYLIRTNIPEDKNDVDLLLTEIGVEYGLFDLVRGIVFADGKNNKEMYCSELASIYYEDVGTLDVNKFPEAWRTPDNLIEAVCDATGSSPIYVEIDKGNLNAV